MSLSIGFDYRGGRLTGSAVKAAGAGFVIRYVALGSSDKWIDASEYASMRAAGVTVLFVAEGTTTDTNGGYNAGVANAKAAKSYVVSIGAPANSVIFAADDRNEAPAPITQAQLDYVRGFRDVLGIASTGAYGFAEFIQACQVNGLASVYWQAGHVPASGSGVHFWQRNAGTTQETVSGIQVDINDQLLPLPGDLVTEPWNPNDMNALIGRVDAILRNVPAVDYVGAPAGVKGEINGLQGGLHYIATLLENVQSIVSATKSSVDDVHAALLTGSAATPAGQSLVTLFGNIATVVAQIAATPEAAVSQADVTAAVEAAFTAAGVVVPPSVADIATAVVAEVKNVSWKAA